MENYTQLGLAGVTLGILFFIVKYFVQAMSEKDTRNNELTEKFIQISKDSISAHNKLSESIIHSTAANQKNSENLGNLMLKVIRSNTRKQNGKSTAR